VGAGDEDLDGCRFQESGGTEAFHPSLTVDGSIVDIAWNIRSYRPGYHAWEVWHRRDVTGGAQWSEEELLVAFSDMGKDTSFSRTWAWQPCVTARADTVIVLYSEFREDVGFRMSLRGGEQWPDGAPLKQVPPMFENRYFAQQVKGVLVGDPSLELHIVWNDLRSGTYNLYHQHGSRGDAGWLPSDDVITNYSGGVQVADLDIAADDGVLHVLVCDNRDTPSGNVMQIYHTFSSNWATWHPISRSENIGTRPGAIDPTIVVASPDTLYAAWADHRDGNYEIYACRSVNGGYSWSTPQRQTNTSGLSVEPQLARDEQTGNVYLIYQDNSSGEWQVSDVANITPLDGWPRKRR
jgi:hypothetical protein